jgi:hypothetical protein
MLFGPLQKKEIKGIQNTNDLLAGKAMILRIDNQFWCFVVGMI